MITKQPSWDWRSKVILRMAFSATIVVLAFWFLWWLIFGSVPENFRYEILSGGGGNTFSIWNRWSDVFFAPVFGAIIGLIWTETRIKITSFFYLGFSISTITMLLFVANLEEAFVVSITSALTISFSILYIHYFGSTHKKIFGLKENLKDFSNSDVIFLFCFIAIVISVVVNLMFLLIGLGGPLTIILNSLATVILLGIILGIFGERGFFQNPDKHSAFFTISGGALGSSFGVAIIVGLGPAIFLLLMLLVGACLTVGLTLGVKQVFSENTIRWMIASEEITTEQKGSSS